MTVLTWRAVAPVDGVVEGLARVQRQVVETRIGYKVKIGKREQTAFRNRLVLNHGQGGRHVGDRHLKRGCGRASVVILQTHGDRVEAIVREVMGTVEVPDSGHSGGAYGADGGFTGLARRTVTPVDGVVEGLARTQRQVVETGIGYHADVGQRKQPAFGRRLGASHVQRGGHVADLDHVSPDNHTMATVHPLHCNRVGSIVGIVVLSGHPNDAVHV